MTDERKKLYKEIKKDVKLRGIKTMNEFTDLLCEDKYYDACLDGGEVECLKDELKIKRF